MNPAEFDKFADEYHSTHATNIAISGEDPDYFAEYKIRILAEELATRRTGADVGSPAVLDFGAGVGTSVPFLRQYLPQARVTCLDVSRKSLAVGERRFPGAARFLAFGGREIPLPDSSHDVALAACVFHHVDQAEHIQLFREFHRVLRPGGFVLVFEHNPYNPLTRHAVNTCPFDENAELIAAPSLRRSLRAAGFRQCRIAYTVFFPRFLRALRGAERLMRWIPLGAQYYVLAGR